MRPSSRRPRTTATSSRRLSWCPPPERHHTGMGTEGRGMMPRPFLSAFLQRLLDLATRVLLLQIAPLVLNVLPASQRDLDLRPAVLPVEAGRDQRQPLFGGGPHPAPDLPPLPQPPSPGGGVVGFAGPRRGRG